MNDLTKDSELNSLANFYGINITSLELDNASNYEKRLISNAHNMGADTRFQIMKFLSEAIRPKAVSPEFIFKALKFNDEFYLQNLPLIRATEFMRQEIYSSYNRFDERVNISTVSKKNLKKIFTRKKTNNKYNQDTVAVAASSSDNTIVLQACYRNDTMLEFDVVDARVYLNVSNENDRIVILLDINNEDFSSMLEKKYYIEIFKNGVEKYRTSVVPNKNGELIEFPAFVPKGIIELGIQWGLSEEGEN